MTDPLSRVGTRIPRRWRCSRGASDARDKASSSSREDVLEKRRYPLPARSPFLAYSPLPSTIRAPPRRLSHRPPYSPHTDRRPREPLRKRPWVFRKRTPVTPARPRGCDAQKRAPTRAPRRTGLPCDAGATRRLVSVLRRDGASRVPQRSRGPRPHVMHRRRRAPQRAGMGREDPRRRSLLLRRSQPLTSAASARSARRRRA